MTPDPKIAARQLITAHPSLADALGGLSLDARAGYLAACSNFLVQDGLSHLTIRAAVALFSEVLAEAEAPEAERRDNGGTTTDNGW